MTADKRPPFPGEPTRLEPRAEWSELECQVWRAIGQGEPVDINALLGKTADPERAEDWTEERKLSAAFLQTIALHEPYAGALPRQGVKITGAWFDEPVDLRDGRLKGVLWLRKCRFEGKIGFNGLHSESVISLSGSVCLDDLDMRALEVKGGLYLQNDARFQSINLYGARIGRNLNISRASFTGRLILNAIKIGGNLIGFESTYQRDVGLKGAAVDGMVDLRRCTFRDRLDMWWLRTGQDLLLGGMVGGQPAEERASFFVLDCRNAKIGGQLNLGHVEVAEGLSLDSITIANEALLNMGARFASANLRLAKVGQHLSFAGAKVSDRVNLTGIIVGQDLSFRQASFSEKIDLVFAAIDGNLQLCGGGFSQLDLTGTKIAGELRMTQDHGPIQWAPTSRLILRNAFADAIHDTPKSWPDDLELDGFVYNRFGGLDAKASHDLQNRRAPWFTGWLAKDRPPTPQPYRQCARVLEEMGHSALADDILYAGRERERQELRRHHDDLSAIGLWFLKATIGYGHGATRYFRTLLWVAALMALGVAVLMATGDHKALDGHLNWAEATDREQFMSLVQAASYSLNKLLPVIELPYHHATIELSTPSKLYFQFHKLMGYVLGLFLLAGITGLTR